MLRLKSFIAFAIKLAITAISLISFNCASVALAEDVPPMTQPPLSLLDPSVKINPAKMAVAKELADWLKSTMVKNGVQVVIVARQGSKDTRKQDPTGMAHAGLALYNPANSEHHDSPHQDLIIYELVHDPKKRPPVGQLWRTTAVDFFYGLKGFKEKGYKKEALILIPNQATRDKLFQSVQDFRYQPLFFTKSYHLLSAPDSDSSLNCNKWLLMNLTASQLGSYDPQTVLKTISQEFKPGIIKLNIFERLIVKTNEKIKSSELPLLGPLKTTTIESLYHSNWFEKKFFYSGKSL